MTVATGSAKSLFVSRLMMDSEIEEQLDDREMTVPTGPAEGVLLSGMVVDPVLEEQLDDRQVTFLTGLHQSLRAVSIIGYRG